MDLHFPSQQSTYAPSDQLINWLVQTAKQQKQTKNIYMKNKITCLLAGAALFGATANAEIVLTDSLSAYGYVDMALTDDEGDANTDTTVAEFELGLSFAPAESKWSAVVELSFDSDSTSTSTSTTTNSVDTDVLFDGLANATNDVEAVNAVNDAVTSSTSTSTSTNNSAEFETVTISYQYSDALSFTFGNILSYQGFETFDATGLYQYSYAGRGNTPLYSAGYAVGASADYTTGDFDLGVWVGDDAAGNSGTNSFEYLVAYNGIENLTVKVIYADDPSYETVNVWASYDYGDFTFAVETVETEDGDGNDEVDVQTALVYYAMGDAGITVRFADGEYAGTDYEKFTISPSYAFSDNVFGLVEFSSEEFGNADDEDSVAVELIYSF